MCSVCGGGVWRGAKTNYIQTGYQGYRHEDIQICQRWRASAFAAPTLEQVHRVYRSGLDGTPNSGPNRDYLGPYPFGPDEEADGGTD